MPRICAACREKIQPPVCGSIRYVKASVAAVSYENEVIDALHRFKFRECHMYADAFGELIAARVNEEFVGRYDFITWAPVSHDRLRERGYDQARLLAQNVGKRLNMPVISTLRKRWGIRKQSYIQNAETRRANILDAYSAPHRDRVAGKRILIIDDVITTGATVSECAKTLLTAGASEVLCAALAKTPKNPAKRAE